MTSTKFTTKQLTKAGFIKREDLNFSDDGCKFRVFEYKGMPVSYTKACDMYFLAVRPDYLKGYYTYKEWMQTEEYSLCDEFNGCYSIDVDKLVENIEKIIAKINELNKKAESEELDMSDVKIAILDEIKRAEKIIDDFKSNFNWFDASDYLISQLKGNAHNLQEIISRAKSIVKNLDNLEIIQKKVMLERLNNKEYIYINCESYSFKQLTNNI